MDYETSKHFDKMVFRIKDKTVKLRLKKIIERVALSESLDEIPNLKPLTGHPGYFRIRFGDYRIGLSLEGNMVWFLYFGKRDEDTYKKFP